ncbi:MAG: phosphate ABC transporter permease PstA [Rhodocyclaceae bacterium]|jgi:phosphate transport system permease protein|nr:phosphate ABC transporter permease PstA [Rhodocyclaceae bacterium]
MSTQNTSTVALMKEEGSARPVRTFSADLSAVGEPALWAFGGALALGILLISGFLFFIFWNGVATFWPRPIEVVTLQDGSKLAGEISRTNLFRPDPSLLATLTDAQRAQIREEDGYVHRTLIRTGNYDLYNEDFRWVSDYEIARKSREPGIYFIERQEWGVFVGRIRQVILDGVEQDPAQLGQDRLQAEQRAARARFMTIREIERGEIGKINHQIESERLALRRVEIRHGVDSAQYRDRVREAELRIAELEKAYGVLQAKADAIKAVDARYRVVLEDIGGASKETGLSQIVRYYAANDIGFLDKLGIYLSRWAEFLTSEPREANTEGGILPAIFGTVTMTMLMVLVVAPFGVITALYLREYAKQGTAVAMVRIAVNNLAGVPSIVYGVFGLGFFAYTLGGGIDALFFPERLPSPTFGTGGILWSSLTLALLTVPVVIVASEEALAAVPRSIREGALACGASKWQTIRSIVLPHALPGVMTGLILAMARGAGEVAPLMLVGVVKLAPELPIDGVFPYVHLERSFMHLGFHIFDVGFQSRNSEAGKPMVFVTTLLLLGLIVLMNSSAIYIRNRLKKKFVGSQF